ncbi:MAG: GGDEF domain-containing protein [Candidatus Eremiobacteraeota bacterium]|nr:GGDEF domain-containing protein [Candidatus Eremiobacteraeota bacterium]MBV8339282.1 GGDEF domain-containing protein [Candidatus Eremiobacteraeota bacterium]MBV8460809.1 GGDEF domain-containing protein [Candidatus Eremiobacteraeota bacterium]MBV8596919.1 GGDEF domain-containing protein [Candidatus Eremiobacteraeota bacterium]
MSPSKLNNRFRRLLGFVTGDATPLPQGPEGDDDLPAAEPDRPAAADETAAVPLPGGGDDFDRLLKEGRIRTLFQPIVSLADGSVFGYEALSRGPIGTRLESADALFSTAAERGVAAQLERICRFRAIANASAIPPGCYLFLNISPRVFEERNEALSRDVVDQNRLAQERIVLEITEKQAIEDFDLFKRTLLHYNRQGFKVAIDDAGAGHNSLRAVTEVRPHFIKLDIALVRDIDRDRAKHALVSAIIIFARRIDAKVLAEGIETVEELATLIEIGVEYGQGFLLARPSSVFAEPKAEIAAFIRERASASRSAPAPKRMTVSAVTRRAPALAPSAYTMEVMEIFDRNPDLDSVVLTDAGAPVGLVSRTKLYERLSHQFGYSIYARRPARLVMDDSYLAVDVNDSIDDVARKVVHRRRSEMYDEIVVLENGAYSGVVSVRDLLHTMTEFQASVSRYSNPLTGLPGRMLVQQEIERRGAAGTPFALLHVDINHLRHYNERYGFGRGDEIINMLAETLSSAARSLDAQHSLVGHLGGVNFVVLCAEQRVEQLATAVIGEFERKVASLHVSRELPLIEAHTPTGRPDPEVTLTVIGLCSSRTALPTFSAVASTLSRFKRAARNLRMSSFVLDGNLMTSGELLPRRIG